MGALFCGLVVGCILGLVSVIDSSHASYSWCMVGI